MNLTVLAYHAVASSPNPLAVDVTRLREQLELLLDKGWLPVLLGAERKARKAFAVTFDDGFRSVYDRARPVLADLGVTATIFLPTALIGTERPVSWPGLNRAGMPDEELLPMTWGQVRELVDAGWEVGSHTEHHPRLTQVSDEALERELAGSRSTCQEMTGTSCRTLAYPFGAADGRVVEAARRAGYGRAVTMSRLRCAGELALPRTGVYSHDGSRRFALKVSRPLQTSAAETALSTLHGAR